MKFATEKTAYIMAKLEYKKEALQFISHIEKFVSVIQYVQ